MPSWSEADMLRWSGEFWWPFVRTLALFAAAPVFSGATIPVPLKVALAVVLAFLLASIVPQSAPLDLTWRALVLTGEQIVVGLAMGFAMQIALSAMSLAGDFVGVQMGFGFATLLGVEGNFAVPVMADFFGLVGLVLFLAFNGHLVLIGALVKSFAVIPVAVGGTIHAAGWGALANAGAMLFEIGVFLALPVVAVVLTMHLAVGTLSRAAPQVNLMSVGFALFLWVGIAATVTLVPFFPPAVEHMIEAGMSLMGSVVRPAP
ncbi:MAG TPA: flagellar biosynthetic protein FliR [Stellaceae bacterium]|nr:flagellar biosynthetic protein FliR [Stellaceae bacterium]